MKKIVWIDVGTHFAQEYKSAFGSNFEFIQQLFRRLVGRIIFLRGSFPELHLVRNILSSRKFFKKNKSRFNFFFVEANSKIVSQKKIYLEADAVFNFALTSNDAEVTEITKLYLANNDDTSQGSSIYTEKANVTKDLFTLCLGIQPSSFFSALGRHLKEMDDDYVVLLRLNCEGVEDEVIYAAYECFGSKLKLICGSLKDVKGVKGKKSYVDMQNFMANKNLPFVFFSPEIDSWPKAHSAIKDLLNQ
jgi:hypothetical protein